MTDRDITALPAAPTDSLRRADAPASASADLAARTQRPGGPGHAGMAGGEAGAVLASPYPEPPAPLSPPPVAPSGPRLTIAPSALPTGAAAAPPGPPASSATPVASPERPTPAEAAPTAPGPVPAADPPALGTFLSGGDQRIRDLLAYGLAVEAGTPVGPAEIRALRERAEAELHAHAFRTLHNQVEAIRREAMDEQIRRVPRALSFNQTVLANLAAVGMGLVVILLLWLASPHFPLR